MKASIAIDDKGRKRVLEPCLEPCPIERGMRLIGGKWKGSILWHLKDGPVRINDLSRQLGGASLPTSVGSVKTFTDGPVEGPLRAVVHGRTPSKSRAVHDVTFADAEGRVVAVLQGVETHLRPADA